MKKLELYVHIPFCERKCNYCDFVSFCSDTETIDLYIKALLKEIENKKYLANDYEISSIFIGGGTPSYINDKYIRFIIESIKNGYRLANEVEISIELNPHSTMSDKLKTYFDIGINRLSFGLQSANDDELKVLGRVHTFSDFLNAYNDAIHVGFKNINVDVINGIPYETADSYKKSLKQILMLHLNHISIYNLIVEPNTPFYEMQSNGTLHLPDDNEMEKIDSITKELTNYYRMQRYEISNYAKPGFECRHNLGYWSDIEYLGLGLNASSYYQDVRYRNKKNLKDYLSLNYDYYLTSNDKSTYYDQIDFLDKNELMSEYFFLGMRKTKGIDAKAFFYRFNEIFENTFYFPLKKWIDNGMIIKDDTNYRFSEHGLNISNTILSDFLL